MINAEGAIARTRETEAVETNLIDCSHLCERSLFITMLE